MPTTKRRADRFGRSALPVERPPTLQELLADDEGADE